MNSVIREVQWSCITFSTRNSHYLNKASDSLLRSWNTAYIEMYKHIHVHKCQLTVGLYSDIR